MMTGMNLQLLTLLVQLVSATLMTGVIWYVQVVTYPQFLNIGESSFRAYHENYSLRVSLIVIPPMLLELVASLLGVVLFWSSPELRGWMVVGAVVTVSVWLCTFVIQVPLHTQLSNGFSEAAVKSLVRTNWIRTTLWTAHCGIVIVALYQYLKAPE